MQTQTYWERLDAARQNGPPPPPLAPFKLRPALKDYLWGGTRLKDQWGKRSDQAVVAESWELSAHPDGPGRIVGGPFEGLLFNEFLARHPEACGGGCQEGFPLLVKLIDAKQPLSVQVHPPDAYAKAHEGELGKTEMWVILDCEADSFLYYGFAGPVSRDQVRQSIEADSLTDLLYKRPVQPGDVVFIPAGTIHAIGAGILLAEIQQSSNSTYRVFDYGRVDAKGQRRPLHVEKALDVMTLGPANPAVPGAEPPVTAQSYVWETLARCPCFGVSRLLLEGRFLWPMRRNAFGALLCVEGAVTVESENGTLVLHKGDCAFVPATQKGVWLEGAAEVLFAGPGEG